MSILPAYWISHPAMANAEGVETAGAARNAEDTRIPSEVNRQLSFSVPSVLFRIQPLLSVSARQSLGSIGEMHRHTECAKMTRNLENKFKRRK
ncbi:hypothetical protein DXV75_14610 [Alteromonas aestuariivivens]|uniref:Uncharacterized protein n=1 Tax=Alteromonas aestuariivivens TaxID=1938339 RepID=A0A3D8M3D4_9ALTE|nr:hypothetical protein DXV75_14610 [Alteromonas aestuariivivens]